jgi:hypothetical protein
MGTVGASRDMTAKRSCAAALNGTHDFELVPADVPCVCRTPPLTHASMYCRAMGSTMGTEDIRELS